MAKISKNQKGYFTSREIFPKIKKYLEGQKQGRLLDLGAGWGNVSDSISKLGFDVVAVEQSADRLNFAKKNYPQIRFYDSDIYEINKKVLPFEEPFDFVIATEVIEHLFDPERFLQIAYEALKENGILLLSTPYHGYLKNLLLSLFNRMDDHYKALEKGGHIKFFSRKTLWRLLQGCRFETLQFIGTGRAPFLWKSMIVICEKRKTV